MQKAHMKHNLLTSPEILTVARTTLVSADSKAASVATALSNAESFAVREIGIFWKVGSSASLGTGTMFAGNIIADPSITLATRASILRGRALALVGAVTMDTNTISSDCNAFGGYPARSDFGSGGFSARDVPSVVPAPAGGLRPLAALGSFAAQRRRRNNV